MKLIYLLVMVPYFAMAEGVDTNEVQAILKRDDFAALNKIAEGNPEGVIIALKQIQSEITSKRSYDKRQITEYLLKIGDEETLLEVVAIMSTTTNGMEVSRAGSMLVGFAGLAAIPYLAEFLYIEESASNWRILNNEFMRPPLSIDATRRIRSILMRSQLVSEETKQWADNTYQPGKDFDAEAYRQQMRDWWPENKKHFETKEYDKFRPLGAGSPSVEPATKTKIVPPAKTEPALVRHASETNPVSVAEGNETENTFSSEKASKPWRVILLALGILVVVCMGILRFRTRPPS